MRAHVGDWVTVPDGEHHRRGQVVAVPHPDGSPPYRVRWLDDDHESLLFPPPDTRLECPRPAPAGAAATARRDGRTRPVQRPRVRADGGGDGG